ncbi:MAG: hypothetical protein AMS24_00240 [Chlamydiae bacterium SM23_39]|nr:MAG: hypothetical protein AMS24_00240 [Chlamydiae bacterium SM23_39]
MDEKDINIPDKIGPYTIKSIFTKGGMSILYLGISEDSLKPLIIKVLPPKFSKNKEMVDRFLKESKIISLSNHPNIIKLYGQGTWENGLYIAMEFIQGISLRQFIQQRSFSTKKALEIILQVAYALAHLHSHKIIHRDLKPENILITESGDIKVIDFGISHILKEKIKKENSSFIGTPVYMSPEQKKNPENVSFSSDIFSLGVITYELVLGRLSHGAIQLSLLPEELKKILEKALNLSLNERYFSIVDFITDIARYIKYCSEQPKKYMDEVVKTLDSFQDNLLPKEIPFWPQIEIGLSKEKGYLSGIYIDFFKIPQNKYIILISEPLENTLEALNQSSILKGMIKATIYNIIYSNQEDIHLTSLLSFLNDSILQEIKQRFSISMLMLIPEKAKFVFASSKSNILTYINNSKKITYFLTPNPLLGEDSNSIFVETASCWHLNDKLILTSSNLLSTEKKKKEFIEKISSLLIYPTKTIPEKIIKDNFFEKEKSKSRAIISLEKI